MVPLTVLSVMVSHKRKVLVKLIQSRDLYNRIYTPTIRRHTGSVHPPAAWRVSRVSDWADRMNSNRLQLSANNTDILWCTSRSIEPWYTSSRRQRQLPGNEHTAGNHHVSPFTSVRNLAIYIDTDLSMESYILAYRSPWPIHADTYHPAALLFYVGEEASVGLSHSDMSLRRS